MTTNAPGSASPEKKTGPLQLNIGDNTLPETRVVQPVKSEDRKQTLLKLIEALKLAE